MDNTVNMELGAVRVLHAGIETLQIGGAELLDWNLSDPR
jgi:hypothetical protein